MCKKATKATKAHAAKPTIRYCMSMTLSPFFCAFTMQEKKLVISSKMNSDQKERKKTKQVYKSLTGLLMINSFVVIVAIREQKQQQNAHKLAHRKDLIINVYGIC